MKRLIFLPILAISAIIVAGGCFKNQQIQKPVNVQGPQENLPTSSTGVLNEVNGSSTQAGEVRPECRRIEDDYTGPFYWLNTDEGSQKALKRMNRYPISSRYDHLRGGTDSVGLLGWDLFARILTAADCDDIQVSRLMGDSLNGRYPIPVRFQLEDPSEALLKLLNNGQYEIFKYQNESTVYYGLSPEKATINDVIKLRPYANEIKHVEEVG